MKTTRFILFTMLLFTLAACHKYDSDAYKKGGIEIVVDTVRATQIRVTYIPESDEAFYFYGCMYAEQIEESGSVDSVISMTLRDFYYIYEDMVSSGEIYSSFEEMYFYRGRQNASFCFLPSETAFTVFAVQVNPETLKPLDKAVYVDVVTSPLIKSDNYFGVWSYEDTLVISPANDDPYWWDYVSMSELRDTYDNDAGTYLSKVMNMYEEYGFMEYDVSVGETRWAMLPNDPSLEEEEEYLLYVMGYNGEISTDITMVSFIYTQQGLVFNQRPGDATGTANWQRRRQTPHGVIQH